MGQRWRCTKLFASPRQVRSIIQQTHIVWGEEAQDSFLNSACLIETRHDPERLLDLIKEIETMLGRKATYHWGPRVIDIDILIWEGEARVTQRLTIPHPRLHERAFVLVPLVEIWPQAPLGEKTASCWLSTLARTPDDVTLMGERLRFPFHAR